ncbi:MAG: hypothetical protein ACK41T_00655 [Pseudobdellovibrio sp.]
MSDSQSKSKWYTPILDWLKLDSGMLFIDFLMLNGGKYILKTFVGMRAKIFIFIWKWVALPFLRRTKIYLKNQKEAQKELEEYERIINDPNTTDEERAKADEDFLGDGKLP